MRGGYDGCGEDDDLREAVKLWETFNGLEWREVVEFYPPLRIPERMVVLGPAEHVLYRSAKRDPETWRVPKKAQDYIHEHGQGVRLCVPLSSNLRRPGMRTINVPKWIRESIALARLGTSLGFAFRERGEVVEVDATRPMPDLFAVANGKALMVVQGSKLLALIWGGRLDVEARGIVH